MLACAAMCLQDVGCHGVSLVKDEEGSGLWYICVQKIFFKIQSIELYSSQSYPGFQASDVVQEDSDSELKVWLKTSAVYSTRIIPTTTKSTAINTTFPTASTVPDELGVQQYPSTRPAVGQQLLSYLICLNFPQQRFKVSRENIAGHHHDSCWARKLVKSQYWVS